MAASGVQFAMIRAGYRGYTMGTLNIDRYFQANVEGALAAGLDVGFYFFSQAVTVAEAIEEVKAKIRFCDICGNVCESSPCPVCADPRRDRSVICVVEEPKDVMSIERTREYHGLYHVLGGAINPMANVGPADLRIPGLLKRLEGDEVKEVIMALDPNIEGEATTSYLTQLLRPVGVKVTRLASGLPVGSDLEYADEITLGRALAGRREA